MEKEGIRDLLEKQRYKPQHLQKALIEKGVIGRWEGKTGLQNVYNLINGRVMPKDAYVFVFLSDFLQITIREVLSRFTIYKEEAKKYQGDTINW